MAKKRDPKKAEQEERSISIDDLKEMKSNALALQRKLDDTHFDNVPSVIEECHALIDRFCQANKHLVSPQQGMAAKHDYEYFLWLIDLAIHDAAKSDQRGSLTKNKRSA